MSPRFPLILIVLVSLLSTSAYAITGQAPDWVTVIKPSFKQVVRLEILRQGGDTPGVCSGVVINDETGFVLTAAHCVDKPQTENISITVNERHAEAVKVNALLDLAIVRTQLRGEKQIILATSTPEPGSPVAVVGFAFGWTTHHPTFGYVSQNNDSKGVKVNSDIIAGDSGGAVIDAHGRLVAINSALNFWHSSGLAIGVPIETVREFAEPYLPRVKP
jgi:S1-C subfamily serine protease